MVQEAPGQTLQATALVHEAYVRLVDVENSQHWNGRGHFFAAAAEAMRRILVENARRKRGVKHGGGHQRVSLDEAVAYSEEPADEMLALNDALDQLAGEDPKKAELVKLRLLRRHDGRGSRRCPGDITRHCGSLLGLCQSVAILRHVWRGQSASLLKFLVRSAMNEAIPPAGFPTTRWSRVARWRAGGRSRRSRRTGRVVRSVLVPDLRAGTAPGLR